MSYTLFLLLLFTNSNVFTQYQFRHTLSYASRVRIDYPVLSKGKKKKDDENKEKSGMDKFKTYKVEKNKATLKEDKSVNGLEEDNSKDEPTEERPSSWTADKMRVLPDTESRNDVKVEVTEDDLVKLVVTSSVLKDPEVRKELLGVINNFIKEKSQ